MVMPKQSRRTSGCTVAPLRKQGRWVLGRRLEGGHGLPLMGHRPLGQINEECRNREVRSLGEVA